MNPKLLILLVLSSSTLLPVCRAKAQASPVDASNLRVLTQTGPFMNGVTSTYNNGTSNLSTPAASAALGIGGSSAGFSTAASMQDINELPTQPCLASIDVIKRISPTTVNPTFSGRVYTTTIYDSVVQSTFKSEYRGTNNAVPNGGLLSK